jgi:broad specificity phosphatase PhoE
MKRIYLIRHGQTAWNVEGRWQGALDIPLGETGIAQAAALAAYLSKRPITQIYSSDLQRAAKTAQPLADALGLTVNYDPRLREMHLGIFQGLTYEEMQERYPHEVALMNSDYYDYVIPGGESRRIMQQRVYSLWQELLAQPVSGETALIMHGGPIRLHLMKLYDYEPNFHVKINNTSITTIDVDDDGKPHLTGLTEIPHLQQHTEEKGSL